MAQEDRIEYRNHVIWLRSYELAAGGWVPRAVILFPSEEGGGEENIRSPEESPVLSRKEADAQALRMSRQWLDETLARHEAPPPVRGSQPRD